MPTADCGIIILAAGSSSRLGTPKQLLMFGNKTLLQHAAEEAFTSGVDDVVVVTGFNHNNITSTLPDTIHFVYNEQWQQGMASSVVAGLSALLTIHPHLKSVIIMLCDQPFVSSSLLKKLMAQKEATTKGIVACAYKETVGVPALFSHFYFDDLLSLTGTEGARKIIQANRNEVAVVSFPQGDIDIDTKEQYENLLKQTT